MGLVADVTDRKQLAPAPSLGLHIVLATVWVKLPSVGSAAVANGSSFVRSADATNVSFGEDY